MDKQSVPRRVKIRYHGADAWQQACVAYSFRADDPQVLAGTVNSTSSGPKDYTINAIIAAFDSARAAGVALQSISVLVLNGTPFGVFKFGNNRYTDASGRELDLERAS